MLNCNYSFRATLSCCLSFSQTKHTAATKQVNDEHVINRQEVEYQLDYALREDLSDDGPEDECGCIHVPPIPDSHEQQRSKVYTF